jgi:hypothetical protein
MKNPILSMTMKGAVMWLHLNPSNLQPGGCVWRLGEEKNWEEEPEEHTYTNSADIRDRLKRYSSF